MKRSGFASRAAPMARTGVLGQSSFQRTAKAKAKPKPRGKGMLGRTPTVSERAFMDAMASLGCLACTKDGVQNSHISLHHIDGRTKPGAHLRVLSLCAPHHQQDDTDPMGRVSVHGRKETFMKLYGTEYELLAEARAKMGMAA